MYESVVYYGGEKLGEVMVYPQQSVSEEGKRKKPLNFDFKEIRITEFSQPSERCPPLAVLHTITTSSSSSSSMMMMNLSFKMESKSNNNNDNNSPLYLLHSSCIRDNKTAVMPLGAEELHLVAMYSRRNEMQHPCFWAFTVASGLYSSCLVMLNLRCLGIVFDLDETLVVANTMRSFEDKMEVLQRKINAEVDPQRIASMVAEVKRYQEDKTILKQYLENDQVVDNGVIFKSQAEVVPALSDNHQPIVRPLIRLQEKNIILTRINPQIRDTSVLVRLRPAWEDLRRYLTARGRKRFEVYVCTMAERDYALEMWRLLDPEANLIITEELLDRIVCVKSGMKKSLFNVFQGRMCHPKMALIVDDRLKVWDDKDQPRVHVVPAYAPYYAPQAEANISPPVLCVARNVACNVRGSFFKEFDEGLLQRIPEIAYEDDIKDIPFPPDVSDYLLPEDDAAVGTNGTKDPSSFDGMADVEVERRLKVVKEAAAPSAGPSLAPKFDPRLAAPITVSETSSSFPMLAPQASVVPFLSVQFPHTVPQVRPSNQIRAPEVSLQSSPAREEGEVPESELDPDTRRRLLILQHGQDIREPPSSEPSLPRKPSLQVSLPRAPSRGGWVTSEEEMSPRLLNRTEVNNLSLDSQPMQIEKIRPDYPPFYRKAESSMPPDRVAHDNQRVLYKEVLYRDERPRSNHSYSYYQPQPSGEGLPSNRPVSSSREPDFESRRADFCSESPVGVLQGITTKCGSKVEFKPALVPSTELQFSIEAWFAGRKIGEGAGRTRREAQYQASERALKHLANIYMSHVKPDSVPTDNGVLSNLTSSGKQYPLRGESAAFSISSETSKPMDPRIEGPWRSKGSVSALKELCMMEGLDVVFQPSPTTNSAEKDEVHAQVEVDGKVLGKGTGLTWDEAMMEAADKGLGTLRSMLGRFPQKRQASPRSMQEMSSKRFRQELPQYPRNAFPSEFKHPY